MPTTSMAPKHHGTSYDDQPNEPSKSKKVNVYDNRAKNGGRLTPRRIRYAGTPLIDSKWCSAIDERETKAQTIIEL
ncbi:hypothetical protein L596_014792 [Steinernema carpocapsae]|uniref:Uncharacterized protein n=1 Tax=Steinernema carpocapsae TaxID=34508 RepID=A0A4U5NDW4_STECR|nr:hypothetical protein L596_014792 [Steinernema carpocapsae]